MSSSIVCKMLPIAVVASLALPVAAQVTRNHTPGATATQVRAAMAPYTAEYKNTHVQTLPNGTTITRETTEVKALDSQGRHMIATTVTPEGKGRAPVTHVMVYDPIAHTQTHWNSSGKRATVSTLSTQAGCSTMLTDQDSVHVMSAHFTSQTEDLGIASIQGVEARGRRITTTIPAGAVGNEAPLVGTKEIWTAVAVGLNGLTVRDITDDPRTGKSTRELTNLSQGDPDPATFQPPEGYEIVTRDASGCGAETPPTTNRTTTSH